MKVLEPQPWTIWNAVCPHAANLYKPFVVLQYAPAMRGLRAFGRAVCQASELLVLVAVTHKTGHEQVMATRWEIHQDGGHQQNVIPKITNGIFNEGFQHGNCHKSLHIFLPIFHLWIKMVTS